jgi:PPOX class probable F420-dependent enzyme
MQEMSTGEYRQFLLEGTRTGKLSTVRADGRPHVAPVWFDLEGETIVFMTGTETVKGRNIRRDPRVALCVDDEQPPYAFVIIEGTASIGTNLDEMLHWATRIGGRYMGAALADAYGRRNAVPGELLIRVTPTRIIAQKGIAD